MSQIVLLDAGPLGLVTHPGGTAESAACQQERLSRHGISAAGRYLQT
jgi:hypothetical protein